MESLASILNRHVSKKFLVALRLDEYRRLDGETNLSECVGGGPYSVVAMFACVFVDDWMKNNYPGETVRCIIEKGDRHQARIIPELRDVIVPTFEHKKTKGTDGQTVYCVPLQAADYIAYETQKAMSDAITEGGDARVRRSAVPLFPNEPDRYSRFVDRGMLIEMAKRLGLSPRLLTPEKPLGSRERLQEFVNRVAQLEGLPYLQNRESIAGYKISENSVEFFHPSDDETEEVMLFLLPFFQKKYPTSLERMKELNDDPSVSDVWKAELARTSVLLKLREHLPSTPGDGTPTNRDIMKAVIHGKFGHYDPTGRYGQLYKEWTGNELATQLLHNQFHKELIGVLSAIINLSQASKEELARIASGALA